MKMKNRILSITGELLSIGSARCSGATVSIVLEQPYRQGLKYLSLFSHMILFYEEERNISTLEPTVLQMEVLLIQSLDEKTGTIIGKTGVVRDQDAVIFDIKPYFPCEDRVRKCNFSKINDITPAYLIKNDSAQYPYSIQSMALIRKTEGRIFIDFSDGKIPDSIKNVDYMKVLWWFHRFDDKKYRRIVECQPPYENAPRTGVFASRSPVRPNPIALTTVKIACIDYEQCRIYIEQMDCYDNTYCMGIYPYLPARDRVDEFRVPKWLEHWPEWLEEPATGIPAQTMKLKESELEQLLCDLRKKYSYGVDQTFWEGEEESNTQNQIVLKGARQNNLKNISLTIPYQKITVVTGVSGCGKSSLVFDTIYAECKRRFDQGGFDLVMKKPDMDSLAGAIPSIAISQKGIGKNGRSTVGTYTDLYDHVRSIYATVGTRHCPKCGAVIKPMTEDQILTLFEHFRNIKIKTLTSKILEEGNIKETVHKGLQVGKGAFLAELDGSKPILFQTTQMCYSCNHILFQLTPSTFHYNDPESMCPVCNGYGEINKIDTESIICNPELSILDGASVFWRDLRSFAEHPNANWMKGEVFALAGEMKVNLELPWRELPQEFRHQIIYGTGDHEVTFYYKNEKNGRSGSICRPVEGVYHCLKRFYKERPDDIAGQGLIRKVKCDCCNGERLAAEGRMIAIGNSRYPETAALTITEITTWCKQLPLVLDEMEFELIKSTVQKLYRICSCAEKLGIGYLNLDRNLPDLSGGEQQRIKLLTQINNNISGILYVLDEPTRGLHPKDYRKLIQMIHHLRDKGNTILMVEHNEDMIKMAEHVIEIGPHAGQEGGFLIAQGSLSQVSSNQKSRIGALLNQQEPYLLRKTNLKQSNWITINGISIHNLKNLNVTFPTGAITCISGVSGSGKSSLLKGGIYPEISRRLETNNRPFDSVIIADQSPIGRTPRSVPATFIGLLDEIRLLFSQTAEAKKQKLTMASFSFNGKDGQCEQCGGGGQISPEFTEDIWITCPVCKGKRYKKHILQVKYKDYSIADVLEMSIKEAKVLFVQHKKIASILDVLIEVGLGYLKLGQSSVQLSGGEAQRLKLAKELASQSSGTILYLFDEPTVGLHFDDIKKLMVLFRKLTDCGNTIVMIEHNKDVLRNSDYMIELGPGAGKEGGKIVWEGVPAE